MLNNQLIDRILQTCCVERIVCRVMKQAVKTTGLDIKIARRLSDEAELQIESDLQFRLKSDPAAHSASFILQGRDTAFYSVMCYRLTHLFWLQQYEHIQIFALRLANYAKVNFNTDIHPAATIGFPFYLDHASGTCISSGTEIGNRCTVMDNVIIGEQTIMGNKCTVCAGSVLGAYFPKNNRIELLETQRNRRHPKMGNNVCICRNSKILGGINIGDNVFVPMDCRITHDVPSNTKCNNKSVSLLQNIKHVINIFF